MDVLTLARILLRRWYVFGPIIALTVIGVVIVGFLDTPTYAMRGSMIVASPDLQTAEQAEAGTVSAADVAAPAVLAEVMADAAVAERIVEAGGSEDYTVTASSEEALVRVTGVAGGERAAIETVDLLLEELVAEAQRRQDDADIPDDQRIGVEILSRPAATIETEGEDGTRHEAVGTARLTGRFGTDNPYQSTAFSFAILKELVSSDQGRAELARSGASGDFELKLEESIIRATATGESPQVVTRTYEALIERLTTELEDLQVRLGIQSVDRTRVQVLAEPMGVTADRTDLVRPLVTLAGLGIVAALGLTLLFDNVATALASRRERADHLDADNGTGEWLVDGAAEAPRGVQSQRAPLAPVLRGLARDSRPPTEERGAQSAAQRGPNHVE